VIISRKYSFWNWIMY